MKYIYQPLLSILFLANFIQITAQQNVQYTQFTYNKLWMNPAYAGSHDIACVQAITRNQWIGFDGAPVSQSANFHSPLFGDKVGIGLSLNHDKLGPTDNYFASLNYAYRIPVKNGKLSIGLQASLTSIKVNFTELNSLEDGDGIVPTEDLRRSVPNFGLGVYFSNKKYFFGLSVPFLLQNDISFSDGATDGIYGRQEIHGYLMAGALFRISNRIKGSPSILLKQAANSPFDMDLNFSFIFFDRLWAGLGYRMGGSERQGVGESLDLVAQYQLTHGLRVGLAYDFTLSELQNYNDGTLEFMAQLCISQNSEKLTNPRFF